MVSHPVWPPSLQTLPSYSPLLTGRHLDSNRVYCQLEKKITAPILHFDVGLKMAGQQNAPGPLCFQLCSDFICWLLQLPLKTVLCWNHGLGSLVANKSTKTKAVQKKQTLEKCTRSESTTPDGRANNQAPMLMLVQMTKTHQAIKVTTNELQFGYCVASEAET